ncbi:MAG: HEAT repeat domain-containing protein [Bacteroidetes bacterium]|nr:HEAT repeat domain-containing protein [Bacteroidota bacterium]
MNHNEIKKWIRLSLYGELTNEEQSVLELHLKDCDECRNELEQQRNLLSLISNKKLEVDDKLLMEARVQLRGAIRNERQRKGYLDNMVQYLNEFITIPFRAVLSGAALLAIGFFVGYLFYGSSTIDPNKLPDKINHQFTVFQDDVTISNISFIDSDLSDGEVEFTFVAMKPVYLKGRVDDPQIQSILTYSMLNEQNPGSRFNSINAMYSEKSIKFDVDVKNALITVVMTDENPGVRREALKLMKKLPYDEDVKQAFIYVLTTDTSSGLRIEAINALVDAGKKGFTFNKNEIDLFKQKLQTDDNSYIRYRTKTILQEYN